MHKIIMYTLIFWLGCCYPLIIHKIQESVYEQHEWFSVNGETVGHVYETGSGWEVEIFNNELFKLEQEL